MVNKNQILDLIYEAIDDVNEQLPKNNRLKKTTDEFLFGSEGKLDSMGLVNFIVSIESLINDKLGISVILADEKAMSARNSPFRDVSTLTDYISQVIEGN